MFANNCLKEFQLQRNFKVSYSHGIKSIVANIVKLAITSYTM